MEINKVVLGQLQTNCYIIENNGECIIIDPACSFDYLESWLSARELIPKAILVTHGHFDHCSACKKFQEKGIKIYMSEIDNLIIQNSPRLFGIRQENSFKADYLIKDGDKLNLIGKEIYVISTSGHTDGSLSFLIDNNLFCGDTLFAGGGYGRCDLYSGDYEKIKNSIKNKLFLLQDGTRVFCGHGEETTIKSERELIAF